MGGTRKPGKRRSSAGRNLFRVAGSLLLVAGMIATGYIGYKVWWQDLRVGDAQTAEAGELEQDFASGKARMSPRDILASRPRDAFAVVRIPRFGSRYARPVYEGVNARELAKGIGHVPQSVLPGEIGNFATAGHRVTFGKPYNRIHELHAGDPIIVETAQGIYIYSYVRYRVTTPAEVEVLAPVPDKIGAKPTEAWMTMVACHPQFSARERYVGFAKLVSAKPRPGATLPPASPATSSPATSSPSSSPAATPDPAVTPEATPGASSARAARPAGRKRHT